MALEALASDAALRERLPQGGIDVLVLDLMLPDANGLDLCQWAKQNEPALLKRILCNLVGNALR